MWIFALGAAISAQVLALEPDTLIAGYFGLTAGHFGWLGVVGV
jgi:hypothetical protein